MNVRMYTYFDRPQRKAWAEYPEPSKPVLQGASAECDINNVVARLKKGLDPGVPFKDGAYSDNTAHVDMKTNLDIIRKHDSVFEGLPDYLRKKFRNAAEYYEAIKNELAESSGTSVPLDVTGPTDSDHAVKQKKGASSNETETNVAPNRKKSIQTGNSSPSEE